MSKLKPFGILSFYRIFKENIKNQIFMSENQDKKTVKCCVMNCQKEIPIDEAIVIKDMYFCGICGVAYYRSALNL